jgi:hypothetical protein
MPRSSGRLVVLQFASGTVNSFRFSSFGGAKPLCPYSIFDATRAALVLPRCSQELDAFDTGLVGLRYHTIG